MIKTLYQCFQHWSDGGGVWIISDTHFDDPDCEYMNPDWPHPMSLVDKISKRIGRLDTLIHLGDVGDPQYMRHIKCRHKVLITGNHDVGASKYKPYFNEIYTGPLVIAPKLILSHEPVRVPWAVNIHGHNHCRAQDVERDELCNIVGYNACCDVVGFEPVNLGVLIKDGIMADVTDIHRIAIDNTTEKKGRK